MSANGLVLLAAVGVAGFVIYKKMGTPAAAARPSTGSAAPLPTRNVMGDQFAALMGSAWRNMVNGVTDTGRQAFTMTDGYGRTVTSDGKPIGTGDYLEDWVMANTGLPATYTQDVANPYLLGDLGFGGGTEGLADNKPQFSDYQDYANGGISYLAWKNQ